MKSVSILLLIFSISFGMITAFIPNRLIKTSNLKMSLDESTIMKLDEIKNKYERLSNVVSPESDAEKAKISDVVELYSTYREIKQMMIKIRSMWRTEASENRREKQFKSFVGLYEGKTELEESLKEKLGLPFQKSVQKSKSLENISKIESEINSLENKLSEVSLKLPSGMSTREERFGRLP